MITNPKVGDYVASMKTNDMGKVIDVDNYWGWLRVKYPNKTYKYTILNKGCTALRRCSKEEVADYFLNLENSGITDSWHD